VQSSSSSSSSSTCILIPRCPFAARWHPEQQIVCKTVEGPTVISTYADLDMRAQLCALALKALGVG
jgi:hypothetical protein